ncbi:hypothetical protein SAMN05216360_106194 [Methylobacterium phyllostachyos]|uniref:Uncharacterized protein n=1 Tax=Methylobacterium phyllostachyos TaxID=582672 RepID=A0A1G9ZAW1_9HYPH|nr:hypothetical protein [Methylobacterium phyllostachyos]SDN18479.1 hypothetical protein SAMN05216360_106194 [Methylobacterium phyllostachyos]
MTKRSQNDSSIGPGHAGDAEVDQRLGRHAIALLQAARDANDPTLIAHAEAMAMAVGYALASRLSDAEHGQD